MGMRSSTNLSPITINPVIDSLTTYELDGNKLEVTYKDLLEIDMKKNPDSKMEEWRDTDGSIQTHLCHASGYSVSHFYIHTYLNEKGQLVQEYKSNGNWKPSDYGY